MTRVESHRVCVCVCLSGGTAVVSATHTHPLCKNTALSAQHICISGQLVTALLLHVFVFTLITYSLTPLGRVRCRTTLLLPVLLSLSLSLSVSLSRSLVRRQL